ncbi:pyridoxal phosphate-dependent aminotransferase [Cryomorphaceae bacterium 1068]|nr:pyridoxal phosphate-dependent aminotransferase [Cryomorphaceae bacterium 1068]
MSLNQNVSNLLQRLSESATLAMARKSRELKESGVSVISLSLGEPDFDTPVFIKDAAKEGIDQNYTHYMPVPGYADFRESISKKFKRDNHLNYSPDQIVVSTGAKQSLINVILATVNPGDEVLLPAPYWVSYIEMVKMAGATPVVVETSIEDDYKISAETLRKNLNDKTRMLIFSSPCNPSGSVYSEAELRAWADVIKDFPNLIAISDEIYEHINYTENHFSLGSIAEIYDQTVTVNGVSKSFAMTGWRIGYIGAPLWIAKACNKLQGQFTSGASGISQRAAKAAIDADPSVAGEMKATFLKRRELFGKLLSEIDGVEINQPKGAFYMFPRVSNFFGKSHNGTMINNSDDLAEYILSEAHVATVSGGAFGSPECLRLSYAASQAELEEAAKRMNEALNKLS